MGDALALVGPFHFTRRGAHHSIVTSFLEHPTHLNIIMPFMPHFPKFSYASPSIVSYNSLFTRTTSAHIQSFTQLFPQLLQKASSFPHIMCESHAPSYDPTTRHKVTHAHPHCIPHKCSVQRIYAVPNRTKVRSTALRATPHLVWHTHGLYKARVTPL